MQSDHDGVTAASDSLKLPPLRNNIQWQVYCLVALVAMVNASSTNFQLTHSQKVFK
jgi:hypothetical protein